MAKRSKTPYVKKRKAPDGGHVRKGRRNDDEIESESSYHASDVQWWSAKTGTDAQAKLWNWINRLRATWAVDGIQDLVHEAIYADKPIAQGGTFDGRTWSGNSGDGQSIMNVLKSVVDTATAHLTKVRSMPCITASDGDYEDGEFADEVSGVIRRKMGGSDIETDAPLVIRDMCIRDAGCFKTEPRNGDTFTKRIPIYEIVYDHRESQFTKVRTIAHVRPESRQEMIRKYPAYADQIAAAPQYTRVDPWMQFVYQGPVLSDLVEVAESWVVSDIDVDDGQHITCIRGTTIERETWACPRFPMTFAYWTPPMRAGDLRGQGLIQEHANAQAFINDVLMDARESIHEASQLKVFAARGANVNKNHLRRGSPHVVEVDGAPGQIQFIAPDVVSKQSWAIAFQIKDEIYNLSGISQWSATANKPLGEGASGKALDTMNDNQSDRFANVETGWQQTRVGIGRANIDMARHMSRDSDDDFEEAPDRDDDELVPWIKDHDWSKVDIDGGSYNLILEPVNFISGTRGGKLEEIAEAGKAGLIPDPTMTASLVDNPDIQAMNRPILGPMNRIKSCISGLKKPESKVPYMDIAPDEAMNKPLAKLMALGELEQAKADKAPDWIIQRFTDFLADIKNLEDAAAAGAPSLSGAQSNTTIAQPGAADLLGVGGPPPGAPMPPPMPPGPGPGPGGMS